jgi:protein ImuA
VSMLATKKDIIDQLRKEILLLQGFRPAVSTTGDLGLGPIAATFPNAVFPTGAIHEFISAGEPNAAASGGFVAGLMAPLMQSGAACLWVSSGRKLFPPGLVNFGIEPDHVVFIDLKKEKEVLWATEEALKSEGIAAVIGEIQELSFTNSRRFQLAVEQSQVTGFILRHNPRYLTPTAAVARWRIMSMPSEPLDDMPGLGFPRWKVILDRVKNGQGGAWEVEWSAGLFHVSPQDAQVLPEVHRQTG